MKSCIQTLLCFLAAASVGADDLTPTGHWPRGRAATLLSEEANPAQLKLLHLSATVDGSGRIIFTRHSVHYEHKSWSPPTNVIFDGEPWSNIALTPAGWNEMADQLDLSRAWIVKRRGRDVIALEQTTDGFDLYLCDAPNGAADYEVTIAIPRRH